MERVVFVGAIIFAVIAGLFLMGGGMHFHGVTISASVGGDEPVHAAAAQTLPAQTYQADRINFEHVAARIVVTPEERSDIEVTIDNPGHVPTPEISLAGGQLEIDGRLRGRVGDCAIESFDAWTVDVRGYGEFVASDLPLIEVHVPRDVKIDVTGAARTEIGPARSTTFSNSGCAQARIGDVDQALDIDFAGIGNIAAGAADELSLNLPGAGHVQVGAIRNNADLSVVGAGMAEIQSVTGSLNANMEGAGRVNVEHSQIEDAEIEIGGAGEFVLSEGRIATARVEIRGAGRVRLPGPIQRLDAELEGAGGVDVAGEVHDLSADVTGVGHVNVGSVTGHLEQRVVGPGGVNIGK